MKALKEGKKIRRKEWVKSFAISIHSKERSKNNNIKYEDGNLGCLYLEDIQADDWEVVD